MKIKSILAIAIMVIAVSTLRTHAQPLLRNYNTTFRAVSQRDTAHWGWTPVVSFRLNGPVSGSMTASVEFMKEDGKPWFVADCTIQGAEYASPYVEDCGEKAESSQASRAIGSFGFKIRVADELKGKNEVLQTGKFKIGKFLYNPAGTPEGKNQFYYYLDNDWRLPFAFIYPYYQDGEAVQLTIDMWFKSHAAEEDNFSGHLFYQGREVASTKQNGTVSTFIREHAIEPNPFEYYLRAFRVPALIKCDYPAEHQHQAPSMKDNPGDYELKVLYNGKLVRSVKFQIGKDGLPVDNGIADNNSFGSKAVIVPAAILGTLDGQWNRNAWQTEAFWGNPLKGFTALP